MKFIFSLTICFFLLLGIVFGEEKSESTLNMFPFPVESYTLSNGMEVVLIKYGTNGTVMDLLTVDVGGGNEKKPDEIEYTHLMEHLIFRGSKNYSVKDVEKIYTKYGIYDQGFTANDFT